MTDHAILKKKLKAQWESMAEDWISRIQDSETSHREAMLDGWILDVLGEVVCRKVIDLGCGEGRFSRTLVERGAEVAGVDLCQPLYRVRQEAPGLRLKISHRRYGGSL